VRHILLDVWLADGSRLARVEPLRALLLSVAKVGGATVLAERFEQFQPHGVTGFLLLAESHLSLHTWVENQHAAIDLMTCGDIDIAAMLSLLRGELRPVRERCREVARD
jgi:S-adenosylmethionine decarboxylase